MKPLLLIVLLCSCAAAAVPETTGRESASWWIRNYGAVTAGDDPLAARAEKVFEKVLAVADKKGNRLPRLVIIHQGSDPYAVAIQDGSIILTQTGLSICYRKATLQEGDARLAFVLGHELAHLAKDDFWHMSAFMTVQEHATESKTQLLSLIRGGSDVDQKDPKSQEVTKLKELQADSYGIIYASMAGYDPKQVISSSANFFDIWVSQVTGMAAYDTSGHPDPKQRADFVRAELLSVNEDLDFFSFGVRMAQLGRYEDSLLLLEKFMERFPSREVYNNLGYDHYQLAMRTLTECNPSVAGRFRLATVLDPDTLARAMTPQEKTRGSDVCLEKESFRRNIDEAIRYLQHAVDQDSSYVPAHVNLASAWLMKGEPSKALGVLDEVKDLPHHPEVLIQRAVALYLFGASNNVDTMDQSLELLRQALLDTPSDADANYNLGAINHERNRNAAAHEAWSEFLRVEADGPYADLVRQNLDLPPLPDHSPVKPRGALKPPLQLGEITPAMDEALKKMQKRSFKLGTFEGEMYTAPGVRLLVIEDVVELVESDVVPTTNLTDYSKQGNPRRTISESNGSILIYSDFALEVIDGKVTKTIYFE